MEGARGQRVSPLLRSGLNAAIAALVLDQASKLWLLNVYELGRRGTVAVTPFFDLVLAWNTGISYGWFQDSGPVGQAILLAVKVIAVIVLAVWMAKSGTRLAVIGLGLIIGGAIGNAIDRLAYGAVVDFACFTSRSAENPTTGTCLTLRTSPSLPESPPSCMTRL